MAFFRTLELLSSVIMRCDLLSGLFPVALPSIFSIDHAHFPVV